MAVEKQTVYSYVVACLKKHKKTDGKSLPFLLKYSENISDDCLHLNKSLEATVSFWINKKGELWYSPKVNSRYYYSLNRLPLSCLISFKIHPDFLPIDNLDSGDWDFKKFYLFIFKFVKNNERKDFVFTFKGNVYMPQYSFSPKKEFKINVGVYTFINSKGDHKKRPFLHVSKTKKNGNFVDIMPVDKLLSIETVAESDFKKKKTEIQEFDSFSVKVVSSKSKQGLSYTFNSNDAKYFEYKENEFPFIFILKFGKTIDRTHENCLVCGAKLYNKEQLYVHLLTTGYVTKDPLITAEDRFQFFPVGSECRSLVPEEFLFEMNFLKRVNTKKSSPT